MEGFVTLMFIKVEGKNLADWRILICTVRLWPNLYLNLINFVGITRLVTTVPTT